MDIYKQPYFTLFIHFTTRSNFIVETGKKTKENTANYRRTNYTSDRIISSYFEDKLPSPADIAN